MGLAESIEQSDSEGANDNKDVKISAIRGRKIITITTSVIPASGKLLTISTKVTWPEDEQDMRVKKVWIKTIG